MTAKFSVYPITKSPGFIIHRLDSALAAGLHKEFHDNGLDITPEQWGVLSVLWSQEGLHQTEIGVRLSKDRHNIARILHLLERGGWIERRSDPDDKRLSKVYLTEAGRNVKPDLISIVTEFLDAALEGLSRDDVLKMEELHARIIENVKNMNERDGKAGKHGEKVRN